MGKFYMFFFILTSIVITVISSEAQAGECKTVCDSQNGCSTECPSEAPLVSKPTTLIKPPKKGNNSCKYAFDGACDDMLYIQAVSNLCPPRTDEADCLMTMPKNSR